MDWKALVAAISALVAALKNLFPKAADAVGRIGLAALLRDLCTLLPLPSPTDSAACRAWIGKVFALLGKYAMQSATTLDDALVSFANTLLGNENAWELCWSIFQKLLAQEEGAILDDPEITAYAEVVAREAQLDPATILAIIQAIATLIQLFRNRKS